jgi:thiosulfate/3-mercaptopyruvate sulfurtransferase
MVAVDTTTAQRGYVTGEVLVEPRWLQEHLHDPALRLVEVDVNPVAYDEGHIEGAVLWNVYRDLKDANYQLVDKAAIEALATRCGIDAGSVVVFYGYAPAMGFWLMKLYGHADVRILDCSRGAWQEAGRPWTSDVATPPATPYRLPDQDERIRVGHSRVHDAIDDPSCTILDVRTDAEFRGERFWPSGGLEPGGRAGHVPSARGLSIEGLIDEHGSFATAADVRRLFASIDPYADGEVITYCTIGARACTAWFALTYLIGRQHVRVYDGSWAQWGRMPATPVECALGE